MHTEKLSEKEMTGFEHPNVFSLDCGLCNHPHRAAIEQLYMGLTKLTLIAEVSGIDEEMLKQHFKYVGLARKRAENTEEMVAHALNSAFDRDILDNLDADQVVKLIGTQNRMLGKEGQKPGDGRPQVVIISNVPMVGMPQVPLEQPLKGKVIQESEVVKPLPPQKEEA
jgi:hypothetical protein